MVIIALPLSKVRCGSSTRKVSLSFHVGCVCPSWSVRVVYFLSGIIQAIAYVRMDLVIGVKSCAEMRLISRKSWGWEEEPPDSGSQAKVMMEENEVMGAAGGSIRHSVRDGVEEAQAGVNGGWLCWDKHGCCKKLKRGKMPKKKCLFCCCGCFCYGNG